MKHITGRSSFIRSVKWARRSPSTSRAIVVVGSREVRKLPRKNWGTLRHLTRVATMAPSACPNCGNIYKDSSAVLKHMNHRYSSCHLWFMKKPSSPDAQRPPDTHISPSSHYFPNAGHVFGSGPGFLGWFQGDGDVEARSANPYYPFLSKGEWEIASFLSRSGLSMKLIDEFLSLGSVSCSGGFE